MNPHDRKNLKFLLTADIAVIRDWAGKMDADDIIYAQELLMQHADDLRERSREILIEAKMQRDRSSLDQAREILNRFTLK
jgi:hypothetical protein